MQVRVVLLCCAAIRVVFAQPPAPLSFEVASVKRSAPDAQGPPFDVTPGGGLNARTTIDFLMQYAYRVKPFQVINLPAWAKNEEYTISAKPPAGYVPKRPGIADEDLAARTRSLLAERFQLAVHSETREMPAYVLEVGKNGHKLVAPDPEEKFKLRLRRGLIANDGGASISLLVTLLENQLGRRVFDETGLTGAYKFNLTFDPPRPVVLGENGSPMPPDGAGPSLFTALQEQLGLKLEVKRRPVEVVVVDWVERPSEN